MFLAKIDIDWSVRNKIQKCEWPDEQYHALRKTVPGLDLPEEYTEEALRSWYVSDALVDEGEVEALVNAGVPVTINRLKGLHYPSNQNGLPKIPEVGQSVTMVSVPNVGLLSVQKVTWLENACTQELQRMLDKGWRILAVCPPNDQRRPDYILGHTNTEAEE